LYGLKKFQNSGWE